MLKYTIVGRYICQEHRRADTIYPIIVLNAARAVATVSQFPRSQMKERQRHQRKY